MPLTPRRFGAYHLVAAFQDVGRSTWSIACNTPLQAIMSDMMTLALFTIMSFLDTFIMTESPAEGLNFVAFKISALE